MGLKWLWEYRETFGTRVMKCSDFRYQYIQWLF
jgi:hypothetical protein